MRVKRADFLGSSAHRVTLISAVAVVVIAVAVGVTIWRYEDALGRSANALDARHDARLTELLVATFWHEHEAMNEYLINPLPVSLNEINGQHSQFVHTSAVLGQTQTPVETGFRIEATTANDAFYATFTTLSGNAGTTAPREVQAIKRLATDESSVLRPLSQLDAA